MKAMVIEKFGGSDQLHMQDVSTPTPLDNEVLIQIAYAGVNPADWKIREGYLKDMFPHEFPLILGWEASGSIKSVGKNVKDFKPGDRVFAYCRKPLVKWGTYAEYISIDAGYCALLPDNLSFAQAAGIPLCGLTAWQALNVAPLKKGQTILILAGAGGVGSLAIQFARQMGARILTTASGKNHEYVKKLGADEAIDYTKENISQRVKELTPQGIDFLLDCVGGPELRETALLIISEGCLVSIVDSNVDRIQTANNVKKEFVFVKPDGKQLKQIADLIQTGKVQPPTIEELRLEDAPLALQKSQKGHTQGKLVLKVSG